MPRSALTGTRIRERRTVVGMKQADLARAAGISASYLNLIEHNRRRIGGKLLKQIAEALAVDVATLSQGAEAAQLDELGEAAAGRPDAAAETERIDEFVGRFPGWAGLIAAQQRDLVRLEHRVASLLDRMTHDPFLSASMHDLLTKAAAIQSAASILVETEDLDEIWQRRFQRNLFGDSQKLAEGASKLVAYLDNDGGAELGAVTPQEELEGFLNARGFHVPELEGAVPGLIDGLLTDPALKSPAGRRLARAHLQRYRAEALAMPLGRFVDAAEAARYDPARLAAQFGTDIPSVFRRLAALPAEPGTEPLGLVVCDGAGALTLRKATALLGAPRFGAGCPHWPLYRALAQPTQPIRAVLEHSSQPGQPFVAFAIAQARYPDGFSGPPVHEAMMLLVPPGRADPGAIAQAPVRVGTTCRVCPLPGCAARREPSILGDGFDTTAAIDQ